MTVSGRVRTPADAGELVVTSGGTWLVRSHQSRYSPAIQNVSGGAAPPGGGAATTAVPGADGNCTISGLSPAVAPAGLGKAGAAGACASATKALRKHVDNDRIQAFRMATPDGDR